jgi:hypothetical protein
MGPNYTPTNTKGIEERLDTLNKVVDEQTQSSKVLEKYSRMLIRLTWALVWLAVALLVFTVGIAVLHKGN